MNSIRKLASQRLISYAMKNRNSRFIHRKKRNYSPKTRCNFL